jgi:hypothetical protein
MVDSLDEARKLQKRMHELKRKNGVAPYGVDIIREVRWFANVNGVQYALPRDWTTEIVDRELITQALEKK